MTHPSQMPFRRKFGGDTKIENIVAVQASTCRVCERTIEPGDHVLHRPWHVGNACSTCGYLKLDDLVSVGGHPLGKIGEAFIALASKRRPLTSIEAAFLYGMGLVTLEPAKPGEMTSSGEPIRKWIKWTDTGARLMRLYTAPRAQRTGT